MYVCKIIILFGIRIVDTHKQNPQTFRRNTTKVIRPPPAIAAVDIEPGPVMDANVKVLAVNPIQVTMTAPPIGRTVAAASWVR